MNSLLTNAAFHHIEVPCGDLAMAERFYGEVFGAKVYMRRDATRRPDVPIDCSIEEAQSRGFQIDGTYLRIATSLRIGFLLAVHDHNQREVDHLAFTIDETDLAVLARKLTDQNVEVIEFNTGRLLARDPFGMVLELWPRTVLEKMGLL